MVKAEKNAFYRRIVMWKAFDDLTNVTDIICSPPSCGEELGGRLKNSQNNIDNHQVNHCISSAIAISN